MKLALAAVLALIAGCSKKQAPPAPTCDAMGAAIVEHYTSKVGPNDPEDARASARRLAGMMSQRMVMHCRTDTWSPELITCMSNGDVAACGSLFTQDQKRKLDGDVTR